jgi:DNA repair exonuclease SbcCD ATPase subunit
MGRLKIKKIIYEGDNYFFESPDLEDGINIIEGENGSGKSTFSNLISFSLGNYVKEFDPRENKAHKEIINDTNNYVMAFISIDKENYKLKRFFNDNRIFVEENGEIYDFLIHRPHSDVKIFSDWLLNKLGIPVVEFYQGVAKSKLNFEDLFRLIYYDQKTNPEKIYKDARNDRNFISDSEFMRKVIFQILMGYEFSEYYMLIGEIKKLVKQKNSFQNKEEGFLEIAQEFGFDNLNKVSLDDIQREIKKSTLQLERLEKYEEQLLSVQKTPSQNINKLRRLKKELVEIELEINDLYNNINRLYKEIQSIKTIKEDTILEVTHLKKIILTHEELNLFSPDTCPYCLNKVERTEGHCICGKEIEEDEYEKFFYSTDEYLSILKSKQKSIETLDLAIQSCNEELAKKEKKLRELEERKKETLQFIDNGKEDVIQNTNVVEIKEIQQKKYYLKDKINSLEQNYKVKNNYDRIAKKIGSLEDLIKGKRESLKVKERSANKQIEDKVSEFNKIYKELLTDIKSDIIEARIDKDNYMPIINEGEYKEASVSVPIRLMYFLTLLKMSLRDEDIPFPRFLLIDTPENLGIDKNNLEKTISKFLSGEDLKNKNKYQVILTTGINKYPEEFSEFRRGRSLDENHKLLLKKKN